MLEEFQTAAVVFSPFADAFLTRLEASYSEFEIHYLGGSKAPCSRMPTGKLDGLYLEENNLNFLQSKGYALLA